MTKNDYRNYLMIFENDIKWGFYINDIGSNVIAKGDAYPTKGHPGRYMFSWENGRVLSEYHFVLITKGEGIFESKETGQIKITAGDGFFYFRAYGTDTNLNAILAGTSNG